MKFYLRFDVEDASLARVLDGADGLEGGAIEVCGELRMLNKGALGEEGGERIGRDEMVLFSVYFTWPWLPGGVWCLVSLATDARKRLLRETLNAKVSG